MYERAHIIRYFPPRAGDPAWDYDIAYSWMLGKELNDPFYARHPLRFAPWDRARRVVL